MKHPKLFIIILLFISFVLLLVDLPKPIKILNTTLDLSAINISIGDFSFVKDLGYKLGLDLQGGVRIVYSLDMKNIKKEEQEAAFESSRETIERRINYFGVTEPSIQTLKTGNDFRMIVELPGLTDANQAIERIGKTAQLSFWEGSSENAKPEEATSSAYPIGMTLALQGKQPVKTQLSGKHLRNVKVVFDPNTGQPQVQLNFSQDGTKLFGEITKKNVKKPLVMVLEDQIIQSPIVEEPIVNGSAVIRGGFTTEQAKDLVVAINAGALPVPLKIIAQTNVGPSLGIESLKNSLIGGVMGFLSIVIFMIYLYKKEGLLASFALIIYTIIVLFIFKLLSVALTLAGIAGFILSIGMAVDANILIFERMKEELRANKSRDIAIEVGFLRAWSSIRDSNISSLITAGILFVLGTGIVRGFALTLAIGIIISMFSAITVTRNLLRIFERIKT